MADVLVIGTPVHNLGVPSLLKAWLDHVVRVGRTLGMTPSGKAGLLRDRPLFVAVAAGGVFSGDGARQPDFLTPYVRAVLASAGLRDLTFFAVQCTALGPHAAARARAAADGALHAHFGS